MTFTFNIPAANNNPSNDQPLMEGNFTAISNLINVDHIGFNTATSGLHQQVHLPNFTAPTVINGTLAQGSLIYSAAGVADVTRADLYFKNDLNVAYPLSLIRAYGVFDGGAATINAINITAAHSGTGQYLMTLTAGTVTSTTYGVILGIRNDSLNPLVGGIYGIISNTQFNIALRNNSGTLVDTQFTVIVLEV